VPVGSEAENVFKKAIFRGAIVNDEARVDEAAGNRIALFFCPTLETHPKAHSISLNKLDLMAFRILHHKTLETLVG
jgi:hypothetical protein